jgi:MacB-like periplasmic core domain
VLSDALWRSTFQADSSIIGSTVQINEHPFTVVGVASARFHGTERFVWPDYWIPIINRQQVYRVDSLHDRAHVSVTVIGRLKPGITAGQATENLNAIAAQLAREYPTADDGQPLRLIHPGLIGDEGDVIRGFLYGVTILALLVLSAACANRVYLPLLQNEDSDCIFVVRSHRTPSEMSTTLERMLRALAPNVSVTVKNWSDSVDGELFPARAAAAALGVMGLLAAMLAITGTFGMAAYGVSRRMKELGIRVALGARGAQVMSAALKRPLILLAVGAAVGLLSDIFASRLLGRVVYQANPRDPLVLVGVVLMMTLIGIVATTIPARKALGIDPSELMREE